MYESADIIQYLVDTYGTGETPKGLEANTLTLPSLPPSLPPSHRKCPNPPTLFNT